MDIGHQRDTDQTDRQADPSVEHPQHHLYGEMGSAGRLRDLQVPQPFRQLPGTGCSDEEMPARRRVEVIPDKTHAGNGDELICVSS
jgi:hypothetical protein